MGEISQPWDTEIQSSRQLLVTEIEKSVFFRNESLDSGHPKPHTCVNDIKWTQ